MISIKIFKEDDGIVEIDVSGHAYGGEVGKDIYCAAVSAVWMCGLNCLDDNDSTYQVSVKSGLSKLRILKEPSDHDKVVLEVLNRELKDLAVNYPDYIRIKEETK